MNNDLVIQTIRTTAALTTSYVAGTVIGKSAPIERAQNYNNVTLCYAFTKASSTSLEIKMEEAAELFYALPYDGQSGNFTAGLTVTGAKSGATGVIMQDTDGGATGTLVIRMVNNGFDGIGFYDNEALTDSSTGVAVVNGAMNPATATPDSLSFYQETAESITAATGTIRELEKTVVSANQAAATQRYATNFTIKAPYVRFSFKVTGTATSTDLTAFAILGNI